MSVWGIASLVWSATVWIVAADVDRPAGTVEPSQVATADESPAAINDADVHITAEDVLRALRSLRPRRLRPQAGGETRKQVVLVLKHGELTGQLKVNRLRGAPRRAHQTL